MSRSYKGVFPKKNWVYSVEDLMRMYEVTANTVSNWVGDGLVPSDSIRPHLFQGAAVASFHKLRCARLRGTLRPGEFKCFRCSTGVFPDVATIVDYMPSSGKHMYQATCPDCSGRVQKFSNETDRDMIEDCRNPNTTSHCLHEEDSVVSGGIWIKGGIHCPNLWLANDRIIFAWLNFAGRYDVKTTDRHLAAIRYLETMTAGKAFGQLNVQDVSKVRDDLKRRSNTEGLDPLSASSIRHTVSHLTAFLNWLLKQQGFRRLPKDLPDYLKLPKAVLAAAMPTKRKVYPTLLEAEALLHAMPSKSLVDHRARAIFALAFLGALRADTLVSLKIKHFDIENRLILQDARKVRAKGGKSLKISWFKIQKSFEAIVVEWVDVLVRLGFRSEDALFPDVKFLKHQFGSLEHSREPIPVMSSFYAVTKAFAIACRDNMIKFTPHAGKYTIGAERDARPLTQLQRKAWSQIMGHENEQTTERYYGKLPDERCIEIMETIKDIDEVGIFEFPDEAKIELVDAVLDKLGKR